MRDKLGKPKLFFLLFMAAGGALFWSTLVHEGVHYYTAEQPVALCLNVASSLWSGNPLDKFGYMSLYSLEPAGAEKEAYVYGIITMVLLFAISFYIFVKHEADLMQLGEAVKK